MGDRAESLLGLSAILAPLIARAIELGRGPSSLMEWVATRWEGQDCSRQMVERLARELAETLAASFAFTNLERETIAVIRMPTWGIHFPLELPSDFPLSTLR